MVIKISRIARGLYSLSFSCGDKIAITIEIPMYVKYTCSRSYISASLDKIGKEYGLQPQLLKRETNHLEISKNKYNTLKRIWEPYLKLEVFFLGVVYARHDLEMQRMTTIGVKETFAEPSFGWNCFRLWNDFREVYAFENKYARAYLRRSIKSGGVTAFNRFSESKQFVKRILTIEKHLNIYDNGISKVIDYYLE